MANNTGATCYFIDSFKNALLIAKPMCAIQRTVACHVTKMSLDRHEHVTPSSQNSCMQSAAKYSMALQSNLLDQTDCQHAVATSTLDVGLDDFNKQRLRILRCTAKALANGLGGLRFKPGTCAWLENLSAIQPVLATCSKRQLEMCRMTANV